MAYPYQQLSSVRTYKRACPKFETATGKVVALVESAMYEARAQATIKL